MEVLLSQCLSVFVEVNDQVYDCQLQVYFSVCPSIWLIELDKLDKRVEAKIAREAFENSNLTTQPPTTTMGKQ